MSPSFVNSSSPWFLRQGLKMSWELSDPPRLSEPQAFSIHQGWLPSEFPGHSPVLAFSALEFHMPP